MLIQVLIFWVLRAEVKIRFGLTKRLTTHCAAAHAQQRVVAIGNVRTRDESRLSVSSRSSPQTVSCKPSVPYGIIYTNTEYTTNTKNTKITS